MRALAWKLCPPLVAGLVALAVAAPAQAASYRVVHLGVLAGPSVSEGLNRTGTVAATGTDASFTRQGPFLWHDGTLTRLTPWSSDSGCNVVDLNDADVVLATGYCRPGVYHDVWLLTTGGVRGFQSPDGATLTPYSINDAGQVAGEADCYNGVPTCVAGPFLWKPGAPHYTVLTPVARVEGGSAVDTPALDEAAGTACFRPCGSATPPEQPFWYASGTVRWLPVPHGYDYAEADAANRSGTVAGTSFVFDELEGDVPYPTVWRGGETAVIGNGNLFGYANDVNATGTVVGVAIISNISGATYGFLWHGGAAVNLNKATGIRGLQPLRIDDAGQILAYGRDGEYLLLEPVS